MLITDEKLAETNEELYLRVIMNKNVIFTQEKLY
jgi:hypothetical protein